MKLNKILFGTLMIAAAGLLFSCSSKDDDNGGGNEINNGEREKEVKGEMKKAELLGFVMDTNGSPLAGVKVGSGTAVTTTDASGAFALANIEVVKGRTVVDFKKDGYFDVVRSFTEADKDKWEVVMVSRSNSAITDNSTYASVDNQTLSTTDGMQVKLPADAYKNAETGKDYTGVVKTEMLYLDPDDDNFATMMPGGDLAAVDADNKTVQLVSYGMTKVEMTDNSGNKLQLKDGKEAELTFPIPESLKDNTPNQIPLWSFNESTGLWEEEGLATLQNGVYVGTVKHFSWVNLDWPESRVTVIIKVKTKKGTLVPWTVVHVGQTTCTTNSQGEAQCYIPENTDVKIWVDSEDYGDYTPIVSIDVHGAAGGGTIRQELILPDLAYVKGKVVNTSGSPLSTVWITYGGQQTKYYHTDLDGSFQILAPKDYRGKAKLKIRAFNGEIFTKDITLNGSDVDLGDIDINAKIDPDNGQGGIVYVSLNTGDKKTYELPVYLSSNNSLASGAIIIDNTFIITNEDEYDSDDIDWDDPNFQMTRWFFESDNYDRTTGTAQGYFSYMIEGQKGHTNAYTSEANFTVAFKGNQFVLDMDGTGFFYTEEMMQGDDFDWNTPNASFVGGGLAYNILMSGETKKPFYKATAPSFMPFLPGTTQYPIGIVFTSNYFQNGAQAYANGTNDDFNKLIAEADKNLTQANGWTKYVEDVGEGSGIGGNGEVTRYEEISYYNASAGKVLTIEFDPWAKWSDDYLNETSSAYNFDAPISVYAVEGLTVDQSNSFYQSQYQYKSKKRAAVKKFTAMKNKLASFFK